MLPSNVRLEQDDADLLRISISSPAIAMLGLMIVTMMISSLAVVGLEPLIRYPGWAGAFILGMILGLILFVGGRILEISRSHGTVRLGWGWRRFMWSLRTSTLEQVKGLALESYLSLAQRPIELGAAPARTTPDTYQLLLYWGEDQVRFCDSPNLDALVTLTSKLARFSGWSMLKVVPESVLVEGTISPSALLRNRAAQGWVPFPFPPERSFSVTDVPDGLRLEIEPFRPWLCWFIRLIILGMCVGPMLYMLLSCSGDGDWFIIVLIQSLCWLQVIPLVREQKRFGRDLILRRDQIEVIELSTLRGLRTRVIAAQAILAIKIGHVKRQLDPFGLADRHQELIIDDGRDPLRIGPGIPWVKLAWLRRLILATFFPAAAA